MIVTPEIVRPIPDSQPLPGLNYPKTFLPDNSTTPLRHPGMDATGPVPVTPPSPTIPLEQLVQHQRQEDTAPVAPVSAVAAAAAPQAAPSAPGAGGIQK